MAPAFTTYYSPRKDYDMLNLNRLKTLAMTAAFAATAVTGTAAIAEPLKTGPRAPEFTGISTWLNSDPLTIQKLRGKVVLVDFWTYTCINCITRCRT